MNRKNTIIINNWNDVDNNIAIIAAMEMENEIQTAEMNEKILAIKKEYEPGIKKTEEYINEHTKAIEKYCKKFKKQFKEARSKDLTYGRVGFRDGKPSLRLVKGYTWKAVLDKIKDAFKTRYMDIKPTLKKQSIIDDYERGMLTPEQLEDLGCKVAKSETFYIKIDWSKIRNEDEEKSK